MTRLVTNYYVILLDSGYSDLTYLAALHCVWCLCQEMKRYWCDTEELRELISEARQGVGSEYIEVYNAVQRGVFLGRYVIPEVAEQLHDIVTGESGWLMKLRGRCLEEIGSVVATSEAMGEDILRAIKWMKASEGELMEE